MGLLKQIRTFLIVGILGAWISATSVSAETATLTFAAFSEKVIAYYPKLKAARQDVEMALAQNMQAKAGFWPSLSLSAGYKRSDDPVTVFGMLLRQERFTNADFELDHLNRPTAHQDLSAGISAEWPLFDALQTISRSRATRQMVKAAESEEIFTRMEALVLAQDAYLSALTLDKIARAVDQVRISSDEDLKKAVDLKDKGMVLGADYYAARVMFGDFLRMHNEIVRQQKAMRALLNILMGEPVDREWTLSFEEAIASGKADDLSALLESALVHRPDLIAMEARLKAAGDELAREKSTGLPSVVAFGEGTNDREKFRSPGGSNYTLGLKAEMPLFDPAREGRIKEARARQSRMEQDLQVLKDRIKRDLVEELARYQALSDNLSVLQGMSQDAQEAVTLMAPLYSEGRKSIVDLMDMRRAYLQAVQAYAKAETGIRMSEARLLFLQGTLDQQAWTDLLQRSGL